MSSYPLKGKIGTVNTFPGETEVRGTYGGFTLPVKDGKVLLARRSLTDPKGNPIPYPGWWNCLGGGASDGDGSVDATIGREFDEESMCSLGEIIGRAGRPLRIVSGKPKNSGDPVSIDTAEAWVVSFTGEPKLTDESREFRWFSWEDIRQETNIVGRDVTPFGRTMEFVLWGISVAQNPFLLTKAEDIERTLGERLPVSPNYRLISDDRYLVRVQSSNEGRLASVWHKLSVCPEANEHGIIPGGPLGE
jgi:hypothetical protein